MPLDRRLHRALLRCNSRFRLFVYDNLALHVAVAHAAFHATLDRVGARRLRHEFDHHRFLLFNFPTLFGRSEIRACISLGHFDLLPGAG